MTKAQNTGPEKPGEPAASRPETDQRAEEEAEHPTIRDNRRIDPQTYQVRDTGAGETSPDAGSPAEDVADETTETSATSGPDQGDVAENPDDELGQLRQAVADRTADLQRVQAEYVNYKRRTDRDRDQARNAGVESVVRDLLPVLDSVGYAREHEELTGGFKGVADELDRLASKHGLQAFGAEGDPFDPYIHEALMHAQATDQITEPTCVTIMQPGYKLGERVLRPARVAVAEPAEGATSSETAETATGGTNPVADGGDGTDPDGSPGPVVDTEAEQHDRGTVDQ